MPKGDQRRVTGISHITLIVRNLERTAGLLRTVFDAREVYSSGGQTFSVAREKFFIVAGVWLCIMEGDPLPERTYNHIAFQIGEDEVQDYIRRIEKAGAELRPGRPRVSGEGQSIYFYDYDNHLFELHTGNLRERLLRYGEGRGN